MKIVSISLLDKIRQVNRESSNLYSQMKKYSKIPENIDNFIPMASDYLESCAAVVFAYLFGGLAKGEQRPLSDVDIAVYFSGKVDFSEEKLTILGSLNDILTTDEIDLVLLNTAPLSLEIKILENKKVLVDKAPFFRHRYESMVMRKYFDFSVMESGILRRRFSVG
ncbi:MAG: nucleotidyltransferase domain-containing protein [Candidatus Aminicenantes bacterium]|nr:nucleotidyltransferase domain-containing protein [Candidatus Aminicenantes bacterium]